MTILEKEVWTGLNPQTISHYKNKGYIIYTSDGIKNRIKVKIDDLPISSSVSVTKICDFCNKQINSKYGTVIRSRKSWEDNKDRCKGCSDKQKMEKIINNRNKFNYVAIKNKDFAELFFDEKDTYKYTIQSNKKTDFKCPNCGEKIESKRVQDVYKYGLSCPKCSDGFSYPEKFMYNLLRQANMRFETQKSFIWSCGKRYDFYIPILNVIIETHGKQHYEGKFLMDLEEQQSNDKYKKELAIKNGIYKYIVIDSSRSTYDFMKKSITKNNEILSIVKIDAIDFAECHKFATKSIVKTVSDLYNSGRKINEISNELLISRNVVSRYIATATELGWSNHENHSGKFRPVVQISMNGNYIAEYKSLADAELQTSAKNITLVCSGKQKTAGGYRWLYKDDYEQNKNSIKGNFVIGNARKIVQLSNEGVFIREWGSMKSASENLGVNKSSLVEVCKGKSKTAGGYKWKYKEDYEKLIDSY